MHLGYISGYLTKGQPYTLKFSASAGLFDNKAFEEHIKWYIQNSANFISMLVTEFLPPKPVYITIVPVVDNLTSAYLIDIFNAGIDSFRGKYTPKWSISNLTFIDITGGTGTEVVQKERVSIALPAWGKDLAIIAGVVLIGAVAVTTLIKKI